MCCRRTQILICLLLAFCTSSFCQDTILRIGVTILRAGPKTVSGTEGRDRLVKELNQHKRNKKLNATIEAVPLENQWGVKAAAEAAQKRCQFVISTHLTDARTSSALTYNGAGSDMDYMPVFSATVEYRLIRLSDGAPFDVGSTKDDNPSSLQFATWAALSHIAHQAIVELEKGGNVPHPEKIQPARPAVPASSAVPEGFTANNEPCAWLPEGIPHAAAIHNVCEYAHSLTEKMPNFICDQDASRYQGNNKVPFDLITALVRYEDGRESYENIKHNGRPAPEALTQTPGLWSTGQFGSDLRSIFDPWNYALFTFAREDKKGDRPIWVFTYRILKQNDPLWRLHGNDEVLAPPYNGELWIDQKTGNLLRFTSVATDIPSPFAMSAAALEIDYSDVEFGDGSAFVLPSDFTVTTAYRGEDSTRNVVRFANCHRFRARTQIVLNLPLATTGDASADKDKAVNSDPSAENLQDEQLYAVLREQAIREDKAFLDSELRQEEDAATQRALIWLTRLEGTRRRLSTAPTVTSKSVPPTAPPATTLKVSVRFVPVTVVLRDPKGNAIGALKKEDFELFDNGKPQEITTFSIEKSNSTRVNGAQPATITESTKASSRPDRYVAYLLDDIHISFEDLAAARDAAARHFSRLQPDDRAAIFTTSGQVTQDFTNDSAKLQQALKTLRTHPIARGTMCPPISEYMADEIVNRDNLEALGLATRDAANCAFGGAASGAGLMHAEQIARSTAIEVLSTASAENQSVVSVLHNVFQRTASAPGSRSVVLVSPGFLMLEPEVREAIADLTDAALRSEIILNTLDVRGLVTPMAAPNQGHPSNPAVRFRYDREGDTAQTEVLADLAYSTGGTFFHNNNDLDEGFRRTADQPEYIYVLGFSPPKLDGKFHKLKVRLNAGEKLSIQAREGYYALKPGSSR